MREIIITIISFALLWCVVTINQNIAKHAKAEENRIKQNVEIIQIQKDIKRLDIRLTRNEIKTRVLQNTKIIILQKKALKRFIREIEAIEEVIRHYQEGENKKWKKNLKALTKKPKRLKSGG